MKRPLFLLTALLLLFSVGCSAKTEPSFQTITAGEAAEMMEKEEDYIIVDVRTYEEYSEGHIPGAVCIPNETIGQELPEELPDREQVILVYCRSGRRSRQAAEKLTALGYTRIYDFGGIQNWEGEITMEPFNYPQQRPQLIIEANDIQMNASLYGNSSAEALIEKLDKEGPVTLELHDFGNFEKVGDLPWELPRNDEEITTKPGDLLLFEGNKITIYYDTNTWSFTPLGKIVGYTRQELLDILGEGDVTVTLMLDWLDY